MNGSAETLPLNGPEGNRVFSRLLPLYSVIFAVFIGYSLMITVFTPHRAELSRDTGGAGRASRAGLFARRIHGADGRLRRPPAPVLPRQLLVLHGDFGFFRSYPMYLAQEFHLGVSRISEFVAWVGVLVAAIMLPRTTLAAGWLAAVHPAGPGIKP
jgi:hypothetical protein